MAETYYELLGVDEDADVDEIEAAYREALKETHPDVSDDADASERTKRLISAKEVLTDEAERGRYDRLGHDTYLRMADSLVDPDQGVGSTGAEQTTSADTTGGESGSEAGGPSWRDVAEADREHVGEADPDPNANAGWSADDGEDERWGPGAADSSSLGGRGTGNAYTVRSEYSAEQGRLFPPQESLIILAAAFVTYPAMLWSALLPAFPLVVNVIVGVCTLLLVVYLLSIPRVGFVVFGFWTLVSPLVVTQVFQQPMFSVVGLLAIASTFVPTCMAVIIHWALQ